MSDEVIANLVIGCAIEVHRHLGPGLLESTYETCLCHELESKNLKIERQKHLSLKYKNICIENAYRLDLLVENQVIIEIKCVDQFSQVHEAQILSYLKLQGSGIGLLINFNEKLLKDGLRRFKLK